MTENLPAKPAPQTWLIDPSTFDEAKKQHLLLTIAAAFRTDVNQNTRKAFISDVEAFFETPINKITVNQVLGASIQRTIAYRDDLLKQGLANATIKRKMSFLRRFYSFLQRQQLVPFNPFDKVFVPTPPKSADEIVTSPLTPDEVVKILNTQLRNWKGCRNYTIMIFALHFGLRRRELASLHTDHFKTVNNKLEFVVATKRGKQRRCVLPDELLLAVRQWLSVRGNYRGPFFPATRLRPNDPMSDSTVWLVVHNAARKAGIQKKIFGPSGRWRWYVSPHSFRSTCVVELLRRGNQINHVQKFIDHASAATTLRYAQQASVDLEKVGETLNGFVSASINRRGKK